MLDFLFFRRMLTPLALGLGFYIAVGVTWYYCFEWFQVAPPTHIPIGPTPPPGGS